MLGTPPSLKNAFWPETGGLVSVPQENWNTKRILLDLGGGKTHKGVFSGPEH